MQESRQRDTCRHRTYRFEKPKSLSECDSKLFASWRPAAMTLEQKTWHQYIIFVYIKLKSLWSSLHQWKILPNYRTRCKKQWNWIDWEIWKKESEILSRIIKTHMLLLACKSCWWIPSDPLWSIVLWHFSATWSNWFTCTTIGSRHSKKSQDQGFQKELQRL